MKKNYLLVLFALLTFALSINAQESTDQEETYNMTVTLPDGTSLIVNTNDVDEVTFSEGKLNVSGTSINEIVQKIRQVLEEIGANKMSIDEAKAYVENLVKMVNTLQTQVAELADATMTNREYAVYAFDRTHMNEEAIRALKDRLDALESALQSASSCMCDPQQAAEALTMAKQALANSEDAKHLAYQNADNIAMVKVMTDENRSKLMAVDEFTYMTKMELDNTISEMFALKDSIASIKAQMAEGGIIAPIDILTPLEEEINMRITLLEDKVDVIREAAMVSLSDANEALQRSADLETRMAVMEQENAMLKNNAEAQQNKIDELTKTVNTQRADIASLIQALVELGARVEVLENK